MIRSRGLHVSWGLPFVLILLTVAVGFTADAALAQAPAAPQVPPPSAAPAQPPVESVQPVEPVEPLEPQDLPGAVFDDDNAGQQAVRIGQDYALGAGERVREAVVIFGNATIDGTVDRDLVVIMGSARLASTASVGGDFVVVGGEASAAPGATVARDAVVIGGRFDVPPDFSPGGEQVVVGSMLMGAWFEDIVPYVARGLLWGRLIVPDQLWIWGFVGFAFLVYLVLALLFERPVRTTADTASEKPLTAFGVGLLVLLLMGPVLLLLAASVIGIAVVPFVICAVLAAWVIGKIGVTRWIGRSIVAEEPGDRVQATRSFAIGFAVIVLAYIIPVLGIVTWAIVGVVGLGAATLAFISAYRKENPPPLPPPVTTGSPGAPPPPVPATYFDPAPGAAAAPADGTLASYAPGAAASDAPGAAASYAAGTSASYAPSAVASDEAPTAEVPPPPPAAARALPAASLLGFPKAPFRDRLAAFVLDTILVLFVVQMLDPFNEDEMFFLGLLAYHIGFWTWKQATVGGIITQLRVVRVDGRPLSFADALVRGLGSIFSLLVVGLGALWILRDPDRQSWHDKIAGTYVVKVPRNWPL